MASDLLPLLDELDRLHGAATPVVDGGVDRGDGYLVPADNDTRWYLHLRAGDEVTPDDMELLIRLRLAYPRLSAALRAALTPVMEGEREAREALAAHDERMKDQWSWKRAENPDVEIHLRTALALLAAERAKAADIDDRHQSQIVDYQQEVGRLRAALDAERAKGRA